MGLLIFLFILIAIIIVFLFFCYGIGAIIGIFLAAFGGKHHDDNSHR